MSADKQIEDFTYRITAVLKDEKDIITSLAASLMG
jgi:hypothetical protein